MKWEYWKKGRKMNVEYLGKKYKVEVEEVG